MYRVCMDDLAREQKQEQIPKYDPLIGKNSKLFRALSSRHLTFSSSQLNRFMRLLTRVAKEVKFRFRQPERGNLNITTTCKFGYVLEVFPWCFRKFSKKVQAGKTKQTKRKTDKQTQKKKNISVWLSCASFDLIEPFIA